MAVSRRMLIVHPYLFAAFPILYLFSRNVATVPTRDVFAPLALSLYACALLMAVGRPVLRSASAAGVATSSMMLTVLSYGHLWAAIRRWPSPWSVLGYDAVLVPVVFGIATLFIVVTIRARRHLRDVTRVLNVIALGLVVSAVLTIGFKHIGMAVRPVGGEGVEFETAGGIATQRDIYFIVPDRYGSARTLAEAYRHDNSPFIDGLRQRGFYVADDATANYPKTLLSMTSTLNMTYLDELERRYGSRRSDPRPAERLLVDNAVGRFLKAHGYEYIQVASRWSLNDRIADVNLHFTERSAFADSLYETSLLRLPHVQKGKDPRRIDYERTKWQLDTVERVRDRPGPQFVVAHLILPHEPYVFDAEGGFMSEKEEAALGPDASYVQQVRFANRRLTQLVDKLLDVPDDQKPIILIQADEGQHPRAFLRNQQGFTWASATPADLREKLEILSAFYLPDATTERLYPSISSVNAFRVILDTYFDAGLGLLPDRNYVTLDFEHLFRYRDVTELLRSPPVGPRRES